MPQNIAEGFPLIVKIFKQPQMVLHRWIFAKGLIANGPIGLPLYTESTLPDAADFQGHLIYVSDAAAGAKVRASNGTTWETIG